jgi:outer membrane protein assembly factor BamB
LRSGASLWQARLNGEIQPVFTEVAEKVAASGNRVFAVGSIFNRTTRSVDFAVFAFDAQTGELIWDTVVDPSGLGLFDIALALDSQGNRIFVTGPINDVSAILVRAIDAKSGRILWEDTIAGGFQFVSAKQLVARDDLLFVAGTVEAGIDLDLIVRAYDQLSGAIRWTHVEDAGGNDEVWALHVAGSRLFASGGDGCNASFLGCTFAVRQLDLLSGAVIWRDAFQDIPGGDAYSTTLTSVGGRVYAGGAAQDGKGAYRWTLRGYDGATGTVILDERIGDGFLNQLSKAGNTLYAAGTLVRPDSGSDFVVRAYSTVQ